MLLNPEQLEGWKETFAKNNIVYDTDDEYREAVNNLTGFVELLIELDKSQRERSSPKDDDPRMYFVDDSGRKILP